MSSTNHFYHSFPRRRRDNNDFEKGFEIFDSMIKNGLLATPEQLDWVEQKRDGTFFTPWTIRQVSISFTLLRREDINRHAEQFGMFSLEFTLEALRKLGALPVFYLPTAVKNGFNNDLSSISGSIVGRLGELTKLIGRICDFLKNAEGKDGQKIAITNVETGQNVELDCSFDSAKSLLAFLNQKGHSFTEMNSFLRVFCQLFYPSENSKYTGPLGYYQQNEWRLIAGLASPLGALFQAISSQQKEEISKIDLEYFSKEQKGQTGNEKRINLCQLLTTPLLEILNKIWIPKESEQRFKERYPQIPELKIGVL